MNETQEPSNTRQPRNIRSPEIDAPRQDSPKSQALPCNCRELHYKCDLLQCPQARYCQPLYVHPKTEFGGITIRIPIDELRESAVHGCAVCSVFYEGLSNHLLKLNPGPEFMEALDGNTSLILEISEAQAGTCLFRAATETGESLHLDFFKTQDSGWPDSCRVFELAGDVNPSTSSSDTFETISSWMKYCTTKHGACRKPTPVKLPTRLLDVGPHLDGSECKLCITRGQIGDYLTLSHCWGLKQIITTKKSTLEARKSAITKDELSRTFQDAVTVTRRLGFRYLWIDSLCIIQDDLADWEAESSNMCSIYEQSFLMISATHGANGEAGCFVNIASEYRSYHVPGLSGFGKSGIFMRKGSRHHGDFVNTGPNEQSLFTRAWALQERLLAQRIIHYTSKEVIWECLSSICCECKGMPDWSFDNLYASTAATLTGRENARGMAAQWRVLIENFGSRNLTKATDVLPALSGLARRFARESGQGSYNAGIWTSHLPDGLLWSSSNAKRPTQYLAPSWSWASVISDVLFYPMYCDETLDEKCRHESVIKEGSLQIIETKCAFPVNSADTTGAVVGGHIIVSGLLSEAMLRLTTSSNEELPDSGGFVLRKGDLTADLDLDCHLEDQIHDTQTVYCLLVGSTWTDELWVLVLRHETTPDVYKRVGIGKNILGYSNENFRCVTHDWFADEDMKTITII